MVYTMEQEVENKEISPILSLIMAHILLVEDEDDSAVLVQRCLEPLHTLEVAKSIREARALSNVDKVEVILLDITLPDGSGLELVEELRDKAHKPSLILLSAKDTLADIVLGLNSGADDYVTKPFRGPELKARIEACLRRRNDPENSSRLLTGILPKDLRLDVDFQRVYAATGEGEMDLSLTPIEFRIFHYFLQHPNQPLTRFRIAANIWKDRAHFEPKGIDSHVSHLRKKLGIHGHLIKTVVGLGYAFRPDSDS